MKGFVAILSGLLALGVALSAHAFCGFYVSGADAKLFNDATMVVLMRDGTRTVLSMQNDYKGPPKDFAMVVPVPVVLQKEDVKTLPDAVFDRIDQLAAPRLVEYWEQDPCAPPMPVPSMAPGAPRRKSRVVAESGGVDLGVKIEAQFDVGEYNIVILSASDSAGLDTWLKQNGYKIPSGAEPVLRPYVQQGMKFFVAKVDVKKVRFEDGRVRLSPLRFHYDTKTFSLPVRLGLLNSAGKQDLIVHILARGQRYELANYDNVTIPTNIDVAEKARDQFGQFYMALFDRVLAKHPKAIVTEYAWASSSCDPCPTPALRPDEIMTLGADVIGPKPAPGAKRPPTGRPMPGRPPPSWGLVQGWVLTRLHARYSKSSLGDDLVFRAAPPITGGREVRSGDQLEQGAQPASMNNFQARYAIRHPWKGAVDCDNPRRGIWGGPPGQHRGPLQPKPAARLATVTPAGVELASFLKEDLNELDVKVSPGESGEGATAKQPKAAASPTPPAPPPEEPKSSGCGACSLGAGVRPQGIGFGLLVLGLFGFRRRRA